MSELYHYGVKGMKWGVRKAEELYYKADIAYARGDKASARKYEKEANKVLVKAAKNREKDIKNNWQKAYNLAVNECNERLIPELNKKYEKYDFRDRYTNAKIKKAFDEYQEEYANSWNELYTKKVNELFGENPKGTQAENLPGYYSRSDIEMMKIRGY